MEHNGIMVWNDCYNSNPEAVAAMLDVLRFTPARRGSRCWARCWNWDMQPRRFTGRWGGMPPARNRFAGRRARRSAVSWPEGR